MGLHDGRTTQITGHLPKDTAHDRVTHDGSLGRGVKERLDVLAFGPSQLGPVDHDDPAQGAHRAPVEVDGALHIGPKFGRSGQCMGFDSDDLSHFLSIRKATVKMMFEQKSEVENQRRNHFIRKSAERAAA